MGNIGEEIILEYEIFFNVVLFKVKIFFFIFNDDLGGMGYFDINVDIDVYNI